MRYILQSCSYCGHIHPAGFVCPKKLQRVFQKDSKAAKFRNTQAWRKKREEIRQRDLGLCRICLEEGIINDKGIEVHHIVPLEEDYRLRLDNDNLICLDAEHHKQAERGAIGREELRRLAGIPPGVARLTGAVVRHHNGPEVCKKSVK